LYTLPQAASAAEAALAEERGARAALEARMAKEEEGMEARMAEAQEVREAVRVCL